MTGTLEELLHSKDAIDITGKIYICDDECLFQFDSLDELESEIKNENDLLTISPSGTGKSTIRFNNPDYCPEYDEYILKKVFINGPSRHTLYGKRYDLGIELVYTTEDEGQIVVVTVFGNQLDPSYSFLEQLAKNYFPQHLKSITLDKQIVFNPDKLLPPQNKRTFFTYTRSHKIKHIVLENPIDVPPIFMQKFKKYVVPAVQYNTAMKKHPIPPNTKMIIYATVPPSIATPTTTTIQPTVDVVEHFATADKSKKPRHATGFQDGTEAPIEQWGYWGLVAALVYIIGLFFVIIIMGMRYTDTFTKMINKFIELGPVQISIITLFCVGSSFGMAALLEYVLPSITIGNMVGKFFLYILWYIVLTVSFFMLYHGHIYTNKTNKGKSNWFGWLKKLNQCDKKENVGLALPMSDVGLATIAGESAGESNFITWHEGKQPRVIGVEV